MRHITLDNGFNIVFDHIPHIRTATIGIWCDVGSRHETDNIAGISHLIEHCAFKGTRSRTMDQIINGAADIGGRINAYTNQEVTCYHIDCLAEYVTKGIELVSDLALNPIFPEDEVEREKGVVVQEILKYDDYPNSVADDAARAVVFAGSSLEHPVLGYEHTVKGITLDDLKTYHRKNYVPNRMIMVISGFVPPACQDILLEDFIKPTFGVLEPGEPSCFPKFTFNTGKKAVEKDTSQVNVNIVYPAVPAGHEDRYALQVMAKILGGGMSSRLFREVREKQGLCYGITTYADLMIDGGLLCISSSTDKIDELLSSTFAEIEKIKTTTVLPEELSRALIAAKMALVSALEKSMGRAIYTATKLRLTGALFDVDEEIAKFNAVTIDDVHRIANTVFSVTPTIGMAGKNI